VINKGKICLCSSFTVFLHVLQAKVRTSYLLFAFSSRRLYNTCRSWELGTRAQVLLESDSANYSVWTVGAAVPPSQNAPPGSLAEVFSIPKNVVQSLGNITSVPTLLVPDTSSLADPASIGVAVMLANWT
jgi:hypothetical protein